ncbi:ATP-binding protein [Ramlibacter algicola]|uniref:histidine kinase n=1 Tax=Ramlibacter algicola TaxID=2795217 RepID=A0A934USV3_9BURK|nr:ATP-binding protein [Ramlibacter algicola]MBK0393877.1 response regulator [Ramlibacter algicola]
MSESLRAEPVTPVRPVAPPASLLAGPTARAEAIAASDMAAAISGFDWASTPLGAAETWPQSLKSAVRLVIGSRYPMFIWWGPELVAIYNDAYIDALGPRHPWALGRPARETWAEIWDVVGPQAEAVLRRGASTWNDRVLLVMQRKGYAEETYFTFSYSPCFDDDGEVGGVFCTCTDDTQRVLGERRLKSLGAVSAAVLDSRNPVHACESAAAALAGNAHDLPFVLFYLQEGGAVRLVASTGAVAGSALAPQLQALDADGPWPFLDVAASRQPQHVDRIDRVALVDAGPWPEPVLDAMVVPLPAPDAAGPGGFLVFGLNPRRPVDPEYGDYLALVAQRVGSAIADARALQQEQQRAASLAELDRAKTTFFSNVSHELRTPLTLMLGPLADLLAAGPADGETRRALELAQRNGRRLQRMVETLLDFSRIEAGRMEAQFQPIDFARAVAELASFFDSAARRGGLELQVDCPPLPRPVYVDRAMLEKIVFNLLANAIKYTPAGSVRVRVRDTGGGARLEVTDTGLGIPQAALPHVFERFYRVEGAQGRSIEGSGIGLALVAELARIHHAAPEVQSWLGAGSTFSLELPYGHAHLPHEQVDHSPAAAQLSPPSGWLDDVEAWFGSDASSTHALAVEEPSVPLDARPGIRQRADVLLVDDNADMRGYLQRLLGREHDVRTASDGWQALQRIAEHVPDLVITDVMMARMDGLQLLRRLRTDASTSTLPVIMLSANAGDEARLEALDTGADDFLVKPFQARELLARVSGLLRLSQVRSEAMQREQQLRGEVQQVLESIGEGFIAVDADWRMTYVNAAAEAIYDRSRDMLLGRPLWELFPELLGSPFEQPFRRAMAQREPQKVDGPYHSLAGWFECSVYPVASGGLSFYFRDVLQSRLMEQSLRRGEERQRFLSELGQLLQQLEDPGEVLTAAVGALGEHLRADRCIWALVDEGQDSVTLHGEFHADGITPARLSRMRLRHFHADQLRLYREGRPFVVADVQQDERLGEQRTTYRQRGIAASLSAGILRSGRIVACIAAHQLQPRAWTEDETALVQAVAQRCWEAFERATVQQRQRESERRLREMAESMPQIVYVADRHGQMLYLNQQWERYTGRPTATEADMTAVVHPDDFDRMMQLWRHALGTGQPMTSEFRVRNARDGVYRWWLTRAVPIRDDRGRVVRWYGTSTDIDDFKRNAEALAQAHAALQQVERRKDQFIATLAHELRNPLAPLRNGVQLLAMGGGPDGGLRVQAMMKRQIDQLVRLVDDLLEVSRITSGKVVLQRSPQDMADVLHAAAESSRPVVDAARHSLHVEVDDLAGQCADGDPLRLGQVFSNLLNNAAKYTEPGGHIALRGWRDGHFAVVQVQDNGIGLAREMLEEVFQPFVQVDRSAARAQGGLGIGLSIVRSLVELHGGTVRANSEGDGKGSTFEVRLPVTGGAGGADPSSEGSERAAPAAGPSVLVVDDNHDAADSLAYMLEMMGATTRVVYGGPDAVTAVDALMPDLMLLDLGMPGMDGYEVARRLAQHPQRGRMLLVALTGWGQTEDRQRTRDAGFDEHLVKPAEIDVLEQLLARAKR